MEDNHIVCKNDAQQQLTYLQFLLKYIARKENIVELLYLIRPALYMLLMLIFGKRSFVPLIVNIVMDIIILKVKRRETRFTEQKVYSYEYLYRFGQIYIYFLREPIYSLITKPFLRKLLRIFRLGKFFDNILVRFLSYFTNLYFIL